MGCRFAAHITHEVFEVTTDSEVRHPNKTQRLLHKL